MCSTSVLGYESAAQMVVVKNCVFVAGRGEVVGQRRLPDSFGEPGATRHLAESRRHLVAHALELARPVALRQRDEDRLVQAAAQDLDLVAFYERPQPLD